LSTAMHCGLIAELTSAFYCSFFLLLLGVPPGLMVVAPRAAAREAVLRIAVTYLACFVVYTVFPTTGPLPDHGHWSSQIAQGWFFRLNDWIRNVGDSLGTAFPSSHVAGAVALPWLLVRPPPRVLALGGAGPAAGGVGAPGSSP